MSAIDTHFTFPSCWHICVVAPKKKSLGQTIGGGSQEITFENSLNKQNWSSWAELWKAYKVAFWLTVRRSKLEFDYDGRKLAEHRILLDGVELVHCFLTLSDSGWLEIYKLSCRAFIFRHVLSIPNVNIPAERREMLQDGDQILLCITRLRDLLFPHTVKEATDCDGWWWIAHLIGEGIIMEMSYSFMCCFPIIQMDFLGDIRRCCAEGDSGGIYATYLRIYLLSWVGNCARL